MLRVPQSNRQFHLHAQKPNSSEVKTQLLKEKASDMQDTGAGLKAVWYAAELLGKIVGKSSSPPKERVVQANLTWEQILNSLREDYSSNYFVRCGFLHKQKQSELDGYRKYFLHTLLICDGVVARVTCWLMRKTVSSQILLFLFEGSRGFKKMLAILVAS
jgi:hypothetical protein